MKKSDEFVKNCESFFKENKLTNLEAYELSQMLCTVLFKGAVAEASMQVVNNEITKFIEELQKPKIIRGH